MEYKDQMLKLSGVSEVSMSLSQKQIWNETVTAFKSAIEGLYSSISDAITSINTSFAIPTNNKNIDGFSSKELQNIAILRKNLKEYYFRGRELSTGSKLYQLGLVLIEYEKIIKKFQQLVLLKPRFMESMTLDEDLKKYYGQFIEPLIQYITTLIESFYKADRLF